MGLNADLAGLRVLGDVAQLEGWRAKLAAVYPAALDWLEGFRAANSRVNRWIAFFEVLSIVVAVIAIFYAVIVFTGLLFSSAAQGQEHTVELPAMYFPTNAPPHQWITNAVYGVPVTIERRGAMPPVPALPRRKVSRSISTNDQGERVIVTVEKPVDPAPLPQSRYLTNVFEVACSRCKVVAERIPKRVEETGFNSVPGGDELDLTLYFVCCSKEFRAFSKIFVETPIARLVR